MLRVDLRELAQGRAVETQGELKQDDPALAGTDIPLKEPVVVGGRLQSIGEGRFYWQGTARTVVEGECRRCLTPLGTPLSRARVALITTAAPFQPDAGDQGPGAPYNARAKFYKVYSDSTESAPDLRISHVGYDRKHTTAKDINTYFPLVRLRDAVAAGRIGSLTSRFHGAPTNRSHRETGADLDELLRRCREDGADAAVLVPS